MADNITISTGRDLHDCNVCSIKGMSPKDYTIHLNGRKHAVNLAQQERMKYKPTGVVSTGQPTGVVNTRQPDNNSTTGNKEEDKIVYKDITNYNFVDDDTGLSYSERELTCNKKTTDYIASGKEGSKLQALLHRHDMWHRFQLVNGAKHDHEKVLKLLVQIVSPEIFMPVLYQEKGDDTYFLAKKCGNVIISFCKNHLLIYSKELGSVMEMKILLGYSHISKLNLNVDAVLRAVIKKRYSIARPFRLDLSNFHKDPILQDCIYCPLSQRCLLFYVLFIAKNELNLNVHYMDLSSNDLPSLFGVEILIKFFEMSVLNLQHNKLCLLKDIQVLGSCRNLHSLWLNGNPLCESYESQLRYINDVKRIVNPGLNVLDGITLLDVGNFNLLRNYIVNESDIYLSLVNHFLEHYFTLYDSNRTMLRGLYNKNSLFSVTTSLVGAQATTSSARLTSYVTESRNHLKRSDYSKDLSLLQHGLDNILNTLRRLPATEHDPYSFSVSVPVIKPKCLMISVLGVFREPNNVSCSTRSFTRTFILKSVRQNEYEIVNEMLHVSNASTSQDSYYFKYARPKLESKSGEPVTKQVDISEADKKQLIDIVTQITEMKPIWARKCLTECNWEIKDALSSFSFLHKNDKIPLDAFEVPKVYS